MPQTLRAIPSKQLLEGWERLAMRCRDAALAVTFATVIGDVQIITGSSLVETMYWIDLAKWLHSFLCDDPNRVASEPVPLEKMRRWRKMCIDGSKELRKSRGRYGHQYPNTVLEHVFESERALLGLGQWLGDVAGDE